MKKYTRNIDETLFEFIKAQLEKQCTWITPAQLKRLQIGSKISTHLDELDMVQMAMELEAKHLIIFPDEEMAYWTKYKHVIASWKKLITTRK